MNRRLLAFVALFASAGMSLAEAQQRSPLFGMWYGAIHCDGTGGRVTRLFMYGDGTGLIELGVPSYAPTAKPSVAMVVLRQPLDADYVLIDRWMTEGAEPALQLAGRIGDGGIFSGRVLNDPHCTNFSLQFDPSQRSKVMVMRRDPVRQAMLEARLLNPTFTAKDALKLGLFAWALGGGVSSGGGGGGGSAAPVRKPDHQEAAPPWPTVEGDVHGNLPRDVQGNVVPGW